MIRRFQFALAYFNTFILDFIGFILCRFALVDDFVRLKVALLLQSCVCLLGVEFELVVDHKFN